MQLLMKITGNIEVKNHSLNFKKKERRNLRSLFIFWCTLDITRNTTEFSLVLVNVQKYVFF